VAFRIEGPPALGVFTVWVWVPVGMVGSFGDQTMRASRERGKRSIQRSYDGLASWRRLPHAVHEGSATSATGTLAAGGRRHAFRGMRIRAASSIAALIGAINPSNFSIVRGEAPARAILSRAVAVGRHDIRTGARKHQC
jgi:hypothetical protein